jgi:hypothetical protein
VRFVALLLGPCSEQDAGMKKRGFGAGARTLSLILFLLEAGPRLFGEPTAAALNAFKAYSRAVEGRLAMQHRSANAFLAAVVGDPQNDEARLRGGELIVENLAPRADGELPGAMLHHWRGTAFAPGARAADFERLIRDFNSYPQHFSPEVLQARVLTRDGDRIQASMRVRQHHVITVVMDATYDVAFGRLDAAHGYSLSESTRIAEVDAAGTSQEHELAASEEHGFLWRLNTYWSYEEKDGGLYLQIEAVSLTRSIPRGLGWMVQPYAESIPRESLEFTLSSACRALRR